VGSGTGVFLRLKNLPRKRVPFYQNAEGGMIKIFSRLVVLEFSGQRS